jgi:hypothetical protein
MHPLDDAHSGRAQKGDLIAEIPHESFIQGIYRVYGKSPASEVATIATIARSSLSNVTVGSTNAFFAVHICI